MTSACLRGGLAALLLAFLLPAARIVADAGMGGKDAGAVPAPGAAPGAEAPALGSVVYLSSPFAAVCYADPAAIFSVRRGALRPQRGFFAFSLPGQSPLSPRIIAPSAGMPGDLLRFYLSSPDSLDAVSLALTARDGSVLASAEGFQMGVSGPDGALWAALLGVPSWAAVQSYTLTLKMSAGSRTGLLVEPLTLTPRMFRRESFGISQDLVALLNRPDYRKAVESRTLARVVTTPHFDAVYEEGPLSVPLPLARRTSRYGDRRQYLYPDSTSSLSVHIGVDLAVPQGTDVPASGSGRVVFAFKRILTGNTVVIEHLPGLFSLYFHMSAMQVKAGDIVRKGQVIGQVGMTGFATGPHLHWEVEAQGVAVDPDLLTKGPLLDTNPDFNDIDGRNSIEGR